MKDNLRKNAKLGDDWKWINFYFFKNAFTSKNGLSWDNLSYYTITVDAHESNRNDNISTLLDVLEKMIKSKEKIDSNGYLRNMIFEIIMSILQTAAPFGSLPSLQFPLTRPKMKFTPNWYDSFQAIIGTTFSSASGIIINCHWYTGVQYSTRCTVYSTK